MQRSAAAPRQDERNHGPNGAAGLGHKSPSLGEQQSNGAVSNSPGTNIEYSFDEPAEGQACRSAADPTPNSGKHPPPPLLAELEDLAVVSRLDSAMDQIEALGHATRQQAQSEQHGTELNNTAADTDLDGLLSPMSLLSHGPSVEPWSEADAHCGDGASHSGEWATPGLEDRAAEGRPKLWPAWDMQGGGHMPDEAQAGSWPGLEAKCLMQDGDAQQQEEEQQQLREAPGKAGKDRAGTGTAAGDALLAAFAAGAGADGPIELDTSMLYSPASTSGQHSNAAEPPEPQQSSPPDTVTCPL